ncbi:MAG: efflux RND transporter periplasmic adaptor subunit [Gemmatimonadetes bacterium]|nr:efflux RND transporter periplasmic adaptor subunit [Gemmatimonadota bacterium]
MRQIKDSAAPVSLSLLAGLLVSGCGGSSGRPPMSSVPVTVATVAQGPAPYVVVADGTVEPLQTVQVESQVGGVLLSVDFTEGQEVTKGQPLFHIDPRPFQAALRQAEANLAKDEAQAINSRRDAERYQKLAQEDYVTQSQADQAEATARAQAAIVKADSAAVETARLNLSYTMIPAPISGRTGSLLVRPGNLVKANASPLVVINQIHPILVRFPIQGRVLPLVQKYHAMAPLVASVKPGEEGDQSGLGDEPGTLTFIDNAVDPQTGTVLLKARFDNEDRGLWPGEYVTVHLQVYVQPDAITVPLGAPVTQQDGSFVYVVDDSATAHRRTVELGRTLEDRVIIDSGVKPGERVVTDGQSRLNEGAKVQIKGGGDTGAPGTQPASTTTGSDADGGGGAS